MTNDQISEIQEWSRRTFPESTPSSVMLHLQEEVGELWADMDADRPTCSEALADVFILLLHLAGHLNVDILEEVRKKMLINRNRKWGPPQDGGYWKHIEDGDDAAL